MDGKIKVQLDTSHVLSVKSCAQHLRMQLKNDFFKIYLTSDDHANTIISRRACVIIWCPECWKWHFRASRFLNFLGDHAPRPPRLRGLTAPCSYSRLLFSNQLPTSNFIETLTLVGYYLWNVLAKFHDNQSNLHTLWICSKWLSSSQNQMRDISSWRLPCEVGS